MVPLQGPTQHGREGYGLPSTERQHGPSAAENVLCACQVMATVLHACAGKEMATRSHQEVWAAPNSVEPPFCFLSAVMVVLPPQSTPAQAGQGAPMPGRSQARVWSSGQEGGAASIEPNAQWACD